MAKNQENKERPEPLNEGVVSLVYKYFFAPLIFYKPEGHSLKDWLEELFGYKYREISLYVAVKAFKMPGLYCEKARVKVQGVGYRNVSPGDKFYVRTDSRTPDEVDIEWLAGRGHKDQVFSLSESEFNSIRGFILEADG